MELISYVLVIVKLSSEAVAKQCFTNKTSEKFIKNNRKIPVFESSFDKVAGYRV